MARQSCCDESGAASRNPAYSIHLGDRQNSEAGENAFWLDRSEGRPRSPRCVRRGRIPRSTLAAASLLLICNVMWWGSATGATIEPQGFVFSLPTVGKHPQIDATATLNGVPLAQKIEGLRQQVGELKSRITLPQLKVSSQGVCNFLSGGLAGAFASAMTYPLETVKTQMQSRALQGQGLNPLGVASKIIQRDGVGGLYRGLTPSLIGIVPTRSCYFWAYKTVNQKLEGEGIAGPGNHMASAVAAGALSSTVTCPIWTIKTRMQLDATGFFKTMNTINSQLGVAGFYRGLKASYWGLTEGALQFLLYEQAKTRLAAMQAPTGQSEDVGKKGLAISSLAAAAGSKMLASLATYPHEVVRTRMREASGARYTGMIQALKLIGKEEGVKGLYGGLGPHLMRVVPNTALMFMSFEILSRELPGFVESRAWEKPILDIQRSLEEAKAKTYDHFGKKD